MDTWDAITSRRQVRSFTSDPIAEDDLTRILEAGRRAPSAHNSQPWNFVVVSDRAQMQKLSGVWPGAGWTAGAAATIAFVLPDETDAIKFDRFDLGQAAMQMMITAAALEIGTGQAHCDDQALAKDVLGFPDGHHCALLMALGYPADRPLKPIKNPSRRDFEDVVHFGGW